MVFQVGYKQILDPDGNLAFVFFEVPEFTQTMNTQYCIVGLWYL